MKESKEQGSVRITIWNRDSIEIRDCSNAGKRGKVCKNIHVRISPEVHGDYQPFCDAQHNMRSTSEMKIKVFGFSQSVFKI